MSLRLGEAIDRYVGEMERRGLSPRTIDAYRRKLDVIAGQGKNEYRDIGEISADDCRRALDTWNGRSRGTVAHSVTVYATFFRWLYEEGLIETNPMQRVRRPRLLPPEELDVPTLDGEDVLKLLQACTTSGELVCIAMLAYLGPRRRALACLRWRDVNFERSTVRFLEKGRKPIEKPMPRELDQLLRNVAGARLEANPRWREEYVVPMGLAQRRPGDRDDRVIWRLYRRVAERAGVGGHVHAMRAAFAVQYLETHSGDLEALQALLGHRSLRTTQVYLRKLARDVAMERVRDLTWGEWFEDERAVGAGGFEPP